MKPRIVFAGTPEAAVPTLEALVQAGENVVGVITRPPKSRGRSRTPVASPVAVAAEELGLETLETSNPNSEEALAWLRDLDPDLGVIVAYGAILREAALEAPTEGWINLHFSSLPDLRGAAPVQRALMRGDKELGCSVFVLEKGLDTGPILSEARYPVGADATSGEALVQLANAGARQVVDTVRDLGAGRARRRPQDTGTDDSAVTFAPKLARADGFVDFDASALAVKDHVRAVTPAPGAWTTLPDGSRLKLGPVRVVESPTVGAGEGDGDNSGAVTAGRREVQVRCGDGGSVELGTVAPAGKNWMNAADWWRGARLPAGIRLGQGKA